MADAKPPPKAKPTSKAGSKPKKKTKGGKNGGGKAGRGKSPARAWPLALRLALVLGLAAALCAGGFFLGKKLLLGHRADPRGNAVVVDIPQGSGLKALSELLHRKGVVDHPRLFALAAKLKGAAGSLKAGEYSLSPAMSYASILDALKRGRVLMHKVVIPEGFTMEQIAGRLAGTGLADADRFLAACRDRDLLDRLGVKANSLEGYLFPDTYRFRRGLSESRLASAMVKRFLAEWDRLKPLAAKSGLGRYQAVTLASIIEKEVMQGAERPLVSAVYHNRLKKGMRLQADPTVIYGIKDFDGNLTKSDLKTDTPYNTYTREGLPPGPICSPGAASLAAALLPAKVKYLYFVAKGDGTHRFSTTYREHSRAVRKYQRSRR